MPPKNQGLALHIYGRQNHNVRKQENLENDKLYFDNFGNIIMIKNEEDIQYEALMELVDHVVEEVSSSYRLG